jgi:hypothetical protein
MALPATAGKLYHLFTFRGAFLGRPGPASPASPALGGRDNMLVGIAVVMFVALFGWGATYFGWSDPQGRVQLALVTSFILGIIGGYKAKGD